MRAYRSLPTWSLVIASALGLLSACDNKRLFEDNAEFKTRTWMVKEEPAFEFSIGDSLQAYNIYYNVRNTLDYPFARIFLNYTLIDSAGQELTKKLVYNDLFDQKSGRPFGESGLGDVYDHQFPLLSQYRFKAPGRYRIRLTQFMRQDTLKGVLAVGVRVEKIEQ
jgi:gliding motility-associated lipoprotein GldH